VEEGIKGFTNGLVNYKHLPELWELWELWFFLRHNSHNSHNSLGVFKEKKDNEMTLQKAVKNTAIKRNKKRQFKL